ncbi:MAG TPA: acetyltransferase [Flavobacterium sp.]|jgi:sugar O-acyltransferase (sialic acid O-acetyltransferase NeuD family)
MKQKLLIIGAGNIGGFISYNIDQFGDYDVLGFLDDDVLKLGTTLYGRRVIGNVDSIDRYIGNDSVAVVIGIANPVFKSRIAQKISPKNVKFPNFIAPGVWISKQVNIGQGNILYPGVSINYECHLGDFVIMNMNCAIGHNCRFDDYATLAPGVNLAGFTSVKTCADIGIGATTIQGVTIGSGARVGGQTMLLKDVPDNAVVVGNPGRIIRQTE